MWKAKANTLPLYKDKPSSPRSLFPILKMLFKAFVGSIFAYILVHYLYALRSSLPEGPVSWKTAQEEVKMAFKESWNTYENHAFGYDVYHPVSETGENMGPKPLGWMVVDSIDSLWIMDLKEEYERAKTWIKNDLDYHFDYNVNVFETTIRMLGGLLSIFHLSKDDLFLDRAADLGNALVGGFNSPSGLPYSSVNLLTGEGVKNHVDNGASLTAEVATLQLELKYLAKLTGEVMYWEKAEQIMAILDKNRPQDGLVPIYVHPDTGKYQGNLIRLGSRGDSYYEYLLKQYLQTSQQESIYWDMYRESVRGVKKHLVGKLVPNGLTFIGELDHGIGGSLLTKMDHLVCFYGGLLAVGATGGVSLSEAQKKPDWSAEKAADFELGAELTRSCYRMYADVPSGLSPEIVVFNQDPRNDHDFFIKRLDSHNLQRPETVESLFYLYRLTGDEKYRKWGYEIFQKFVQHGKVTNAKGEVSFTSLEDVTKVPPPKRDNTELFWWAETLKYLYLLFDDLNTLPLDQYVFNTEAHPLPRFELGQFKTGWQRDADDPRRKSDRKEVPPAPANIDKKNPPKAAKAAKNIEEAVSEAVKEDPSIAEDENKEEKRKQILKQIE